MDLNKIISPFHNFISYSSTLNHQAQVVVALRFALVQVLSADEKRAARVPKTGRTNPHESEVNLSGNKMKLWKCRIEK